MASTSYIIRPDEGQRKVHVALSTRSIGSSAGLPTATNASRISGDSIWAIEPLATRPRATRVALTGASNKRGSDSGRVQAHNPAKQTAGRMQVARACTTCASSKRKCSGTFPCVRCTRIGKHGTCCPVLSRREARCPAADQREDQHAAMALADMLEDDNVEEGDYTEPSVPAVEDALLSVWNIMSKEQIPLHASKAVELPRGAYTKSPPYDTPMIGAKRMSSTYYRDAETVSSIKRVRVSNTYLDQTSYYAPIPRLSTGAAPLEPMHLSKMYACHPDRPRVSVHPDVWTADDETCSSVSSQGE
jgi:hypothetical protein